MIQATELRLNNWVRFYEADQDSDLEGFVKVIRIEEGEFYAELDYVHPNHRTVVYEPIPLSPDILEKCGFECTTKGHYRKANMGEVYLKESPQGWLVKMYPATPLTSVKYVHQLMNLYFVITGEELTLNL